MAAVAFGFWHQQTNNSCFGCFFTTQKQTHENIILLLSRFPCPVETPSPDPSLWFSSGSRCYKKQQWKSPSSQLTDSSTQKASPQANGLSKLSDAPQKNKVPVQFSHETMGSLLGRESNITQSANVQFHDKTTRMAVAYRATETHNQ